MGWLAATRSPGCSVLLFCSIVLEELYEAWPGHGHTGILDSGKADDRFDEHTTQT